jgi:hypothetical protein
MIDRDRNGEITGDERDVYARQVIEGLVMDVDGHPCEHGSRSTRCPRGAT